MKISLEEVKQQIGQIEQLVVRAFESSMYLVQVKLKQDEELLNVCDDKGSILRFNSQLDAKFQFKGLGITDTVLVHESPYNEMIGMPGGRMEPLQVKLANPDDDYS
jgi:S-adenosylmethionine/arginine decarboxylase-like enzyme